ncbi:MAG: 23S ribosomal RNA methyltransferase Erm [Chloroflexota bacterium]|nr:23S ribosomal RNA methyltransferase Erm [Chloroflexota bacterium]
MPSLIRQSVFYSQNFLKDPCLVASLLNSLSIGGEDVVYEIGPGKGIITQQLALRYKQVVAIEKDPRLTDLLRQQFADRPNVTIYEGDFLHYCLPHHPYKVFANIPFNITTAIVARLTTAENPPEDAYLTMQKEAAEMFLGKPHESLRTILLKPWFEIAIVHNFKRRDFIPAPRVDVVMLRLRKRGPPVVHSTDRQHFRNFVTHIFTAWQPALGSTLKSLFSRQQLKYIQRELGIELDVTPTSLTFEQWLNLFEYFKTAGNKQAWQAILGSEKRLLQQQNGLQKIHRTRRSR